MRSLPQTLIGLSLIATPLRADTIVYPTGSHPTDYQTVQSAVAEGGLVLLKAVNELGAPTAFDFGPPVEGSGSVTLTKDVEVVGESAGGSMTTILGGDAPFAVFRQVRTAIKGIRFERPYGAAVFLFASSGAEISDNIITGVVGFPFSGESRKGQGVWVLGRPGGGAGPVTGTVTIARNTITDIDAEDGLGLALVGFEADMRVIGNEIRGTNFIGILAFAHSGRVWIEDNVVLPGPERFPGFYSVGNGIQVGPLFEANFPDPTGPAHIRNNSVVCENPNADGILLFGAEKPLNGSRIANNEIAMSDSRYGAITLVDSVSYSRIAQNRMRGSALFALDILGVNFPDRPNRGNVLVRNDVAGFDSALADVFLDNSTQDTRVIGCHGTVLDQGNNNHIEACAEARTRAADGPLPEAATQRGALLEALRRDLASPPLRTGE